jgi:putative tricarboxylic transport membrane protein
MRRLRPSKDNVGAVLLIALGTAVALAGRGYHVGSLTRMGSGYMPLVLGVLLVAVGILIAATARLASGTRAASVPGAGHHGGRAFEPRAWICILGAIAAFVIVGTYGGMVPATFACTFIAALGDRTNRLRDAAALALAMVVAGWLIFIWGLHFQMPAFTWGA